MTPEKQRIAIAEACGWKHIKHTNQEDVDIESRSITYWSGLTGVPPKFIHDQNRIIIPDYLYDLNAMHAAEKELTDMQWHRYLQGLASVVREKGQAEIRISQYVHATAQQRAEAFLRTLGLWEDEQ
jgi:hypothetical protein